MQQLHAQARLCPLGQRDNLTGEVLGAIELRRLGQQAAIPVVTQGVQLVVDQGFKIVGARQVQAQRVTTGQQGQVEFLGVDAEAVTRPQPDDIAATFEQFTLVAQTTHCLIPRALEPRLNVISLDVVVQRAQPFDQFTQLENQRVGGKKGVQQIRLGQPTGAPWQAVDDAYRRVLQPLGTALALIQQALAMGFKGLKQLFALIEDVTEKRLVPAKLAFQLFELHQQARQLLIAALRILRQRQCVGNGLAEQLELGAELRDLLGRAQRLAPQLGPRLRLVELGIQLGDGLNHAGALGSVINAQRRHQLGQHVQPRRHRGQLLQRFSQLGDRFSLLGARIQLLQLMVIGRQRLLAGEKTGHLSCQPLVLGQQLRFHLVDLLDIDVAVLANGKQLAALGVERPQGINVSLNISKLLHRQA